MVDGTSSYDKENGAAVDHKERMTTNNSFYRIPTAAELRQLREMGSLQAGSLLRLQSEELVNSITPPELKISKSALRLEEEWVPMLSEVLTAMHSEHLEPKDLLPGFDIGVNNVQEDLNFSPPSEIEIVGSHALHCNIKPSGGAPRKVVSSSAFCFYFQFNSSLPLAVFLPFSSCLLNMYHIRISLLPCQHRVFHLVISLDIDISLNVPCMPVIWRRIY